MKKFATIQHFNLKSAFENGKRYIGQDDHSVPGCIIFIEGDGVNSVQTLELPILDYQDLPPQELFERIVVAKKALGKQVLMLGHNYQRDDVILHADHRGDSLYIGDTISDEDACSLVGLPFIAAGYGFYKWTPEDVFRLNRKNTNQIFDPRITQPLSTLKQLSDTLLIEQNIEDT